MNEVILRPDYDDLEMVRVYTMWSEEQDMYLFTLHVDLLGGVFGPDVSKDFIDLPEIEQDELRVRIDAEVI